MPKTILFLAANPVGENSKETVLLRLDQEVREIKNGLQRSKKRDELILEQVWATRSSDVRRAMLDYKPSIVHFSGHGSGTNGLVFEGESGKPKLVTSETLSDFFELFSETLDCVVLNACYSEFQADAIAKNIENVIGMNDNISDKAAIEFSVAFYDAIGAGQNIDFAYKIACNAIQWAGFPENLTPVLKSSKFSNHPETITNEEILEVPIPNTHQISAYKECPACGKQNEIPNTFRCKKCKRPYLCVDHMDEKALVCKECTAEICALIRRFMNDVRIVTPAYEFYDRSMSPYKLDNITLLNRTLTAKAIVAYEAKPWTWLSSYIDENYYGNTFRQCQIMNVRIESETSIKVDIIETWSSHKSVKKDAEDAKLTHETYTQNETYDIKLEKDGWKIDQSDRLG